MNTNYIKKQINKVSNFEFRISNFLPAPRRQGGLTLIELIVYVSILGLIIVALFSVIVSTTKSYKTIKATRLIHASALSLTDRLGYEIRSSYTVDVPGSTLALDAGALSLSKNINEVNSNILFSIVDDRVSIEEDSLFEGYLTNENVFVDKMRFDHYMENSREMVSVETTLRAVVGGHVYTKNFQNSYMLRDIN